jgi:hypothetical protein
MDHEAQLLEAELNAGYEAVMSFTEACRFATNDELKAPALQLAAQAETLLAAASQALLAAERDAAPVA